MQINKHHLLFGVWLCCILSYSFTQTWSPPKPSQPIHIQQVVECERGEGLSAASSICTGSIGQNIVADGDFGKGNSNILLTDPFIAPGYIYDTAPPPSDGFYTLANHTNWPTGYTSWMHTEDNSPDPDGYMMVVNASIEPGIFFERTIEDLCENTSYTFSADIINLIDSIWKPYGDDYLDIFPINAEGEPFTILPNVAFLLNGEVLLSTDNIINDGVWHTYGFSFTTGDNETSVTLSLRNNAPGGFGNDLAIDNIAFNPCGPEALVDATPFCEGESIILSTSISDNSFSMPAYQWQVSWDNGQTWSNLTGENFSSLAIDDPVPDALYRYVLASDMAYLERPYCHVVSDIYRVELVPLSFTMEERFICVGDYYGSTAYYEDTVLVDTLTSQNGCDSIVETFIYVWPLPEVNAGMDREIKLNESITLTPTISTTVDSFVWSPSEQLSCMDCLQPICTPYETTIYQLTVFDERGCQNEDEVEISVLADYNFFVPNIFSPNGDGINDGFTIYGGIDIEEIEVLKVFDRWGSLLFERMHFTPNENTLGWDGSYRAKTMGNGVYTYYAVVRFVNNERILVKGDITLLR